MWHDVGHLFLCVWVSASQKIPSSVLVRNPNKGLVREIFCETGRKRGKARTQGNQQKSERGDGQGGVVAKRGAGTCGLRSQVSQRDRMSQHSWWPCRNFARIHAHDNQMHRRPHKSVTNLSLLVLGANPSPCSFVFLFFYPLGCVCCALCVCKAM